MPAKLLDAKHAVIHTASIQIRTLTIEGKQVTLSVFRQLPEGEIIDWDSWDLRGPDVFLEGPVWGLVRYYWGDYRTPDVIDNSANDAFHVVWQKGERLYRRYISTNGPFYGQVTLGSAYRRWCFPYDRQFDVTWDAIHWSRYVEYFQQFDQLFIAV